VIEGDVGEDAGCEIRDAIKCAAKIGVAHESRWPYKISKYDVKPPANVYADALKFKALEYQRVGVSTFAVRTALAQGYPVVFGISLFESFESIAVERTGMVPMPNLSKEQLLGGHCMLVVGYGQRDGHFTVRNSWDNDWGDKGDCYIPEQMLGSPDYGSDYWIVQAAGIASGT
jgi:C1A family cysteine protease